jgi:hypothetical protein
MSQTFSALQSGVTTFNQLYGIINNNIDAIRSQWSGTSTPGSPVVGQPFYNTTTGKITIWNGTSWIDSANTSTTVLANTAEILAARGTTSSLNARLSISLNDDGTLKGAAPVGDWWMTEADDVAFVDASTFTVSGDKTAIYVKNRALYLTQTSNDYDYVVSSSYNGGTDLTTVVTLNSNVDSGLTAVEYGQPPSNAPVVTVTSIGAEPADSDIVKAPGGVLPALDGSNLTGIKAVGGANYLNLSVVTTGLTSLVAISVEEVSVKDASGDATLLQGISLTGDLSASGANGLDTGTVATDTWYAVHVIYNPTTDTTAALLSLSHTAPTLPAGYTYSRRVGWVRTDSVNGYPLAITQHGARATYTDPSAAISGVSGSISAGTPIDMSLFIPTTAISVNGWLRVNHAAASGRHTLLGIVSDLFTTTSGAAYGTIGQYTFTAASLSGGLLWCYPVAILDGYLYYSSTSSGGEMIVVQWEDVI